MKKLDIDALRKAVPWFHRDYLLAIIVVLVVGLLSFFGAFDTLELKAYDLLVNLKPATPERSDVVMVAIDDGSIARIGTFPWPRDIMADVLIRMRELGAKSATFDIEYCSPSTEGINPEGRKQLPNTLNNAMESLSEDIAAIGEAAYAGYFDNDELAEYMASIAYDSMPETFENLYNTIASSLIRDNDEYFAEAIHYFGNSWMALNINDLSIQISDELMQQVFDNVLLSADDKYNLISGEINNWHLNEGSDRGLVPALESMVTASAGSGFTNVLLDSDGSRRRVKLLADFTNPKTGEVKYVGQLVFAPMLSILKPEKILRERTQLILRNSHVSTENGEKIRDIVIPLDSEGNMLINWIPDDFDDSFINVSVAEIYLLDDWEEDIIANLERIAAIKVIDFDDTYGLDESMLWHQYYAEQFLEIYNELREYKEFLLAEKNLDSLNDEEGYFADYLEQRRLLFTEYCPLLCDSSLMDDIERNLPYHVNMNREGEFEYVLNQYKNMFANFEVSLNNYNNAVASLQKRMNGSFCIIGHTATGSTDLGTTPFASGYANIGTHANVYNTIMSENFITPVPWWLGLTLSGLLLMIIAIIARNLPLIWQNVLNVIGILVVLAICYMEMRHFSIYVEVICPLLVMVVGAIAMVVLRFINAEKQKGFLRRAFSTYLSGDVVDQIVNDPSKLSLGGEERYMTAMFTDVKGFSTFSEKVTPTQLVSFLNKYLTLFSNVILENHGTIDKYEGDAIIAFFGAPISFEDHAWKACISAVRMKQAEVRFNEEMLASGEIPSPINTRIGINTGPMVVGNMGTDAKMNYTMMGNAVNLAARLEGVNKQYHSWILVSEETWKGADSGEHKDVLFARRFDRVRVVGISTPVQLYNILGVRAELDPALIESVELFHKGLDLYFAKDFAGGKKLFDEATAKYPADEAASVFAERCVKNMENGVPDDWDGVVNMTQK